MGQNTVLLPGSWNFDRAPRDLLVEHPGDDERQHLALASGQGGVALPELGLLGLIRALPAARLDRPLDAVEELLVVERLLQEVDRTPFIARTLVDTLA